MKPYAALMLFLLACLFGWLAFQTDTRWVTACWAFSAGSFGTSAAWLVAFRRD